MTSGSFQTVDLSSIAVNRDSRQRRELENIEDLAASIASVGLINPPVIRRDTFEIVAGERRLEAMRSLGWTSCPVQFAEDLDELSLHLLELEENVKRVDLSWRDHNDAIARYHRLRSSKDPSWNDGATAEALGMGASTLSAHLLVAKAIEKQVRGVEDAETFSVARNISRRNAERTAASAKLEVLDIVGEDDDASAAGTADLSLGDTGTDSEELGGRSRPASPRRRASILNTSFLDWAPSPSGRFNLIHCDFPYGIATGDKKGQSAAKITGSYDDRPEIYFELLSAFGSYFPNFCEPQTHLVFWFSQKFYQETKDALETFGWRVDPFPFIWHKSDNAGILPDHNRGPRRTYETAFFANIGDRKIVRPVANSFSGPTTRDFHTSEKPKAMLTHFFRMLVDDTTRILDPTCGGGNAIHVGEELGARECLGIELSEEYAGRARENLKL